MVKFHALSRGKKTLPPVLFLHGFLGSSADWEEVTKILCRDFYCLAVDLPGHGKTPMPSPRRLTFRECTKSLLTFSKKFFQSPFSVVGYSMGGRLAIDLALNAVNDVEKLVLESSSPGILSKNDRIRRRIEDGRLARQMMRDGLPKFIEAWYARPLFSSLQKRPQLLKRLMRRRKKNDLTGLATALRTFSSGVQPPLWNQLRKLPPTLILTGEGDKKFAAIGRQMKTKAPTSQLKIFRKTGHAIHLEQPKAFVAQVRSFLLPI